MAKDSEVKQGQVQKAGPSSEVRSYEDMYRLLDNFFRRGCMRPRRWEGGRVPC